MTSLATIETDLLLAPTQAERDALKAEIVETTVKPPADGLLTLVTGSGAGKRTLVFDRPPKRFYDRDGAPAGVDAMVRMFQGTADVEMQIDPHRIIRNAPLKAPTGATVAATLGKKAVSLPVFALSPQAAIEAAIRNSIAAAPNPAGWRTPGTVTTVYGVTADGRVNSNSATYATARSGAALSADSAEAQSACGQDFGTFVGGQYYVLQLMLGFDTALIPDGDTISAAVLSLAIASDSSTTDFTAEARLKDWSTTVDTTDFVAGASLSGLTSLATLSSAGVSVGAYNAFTNVAMPANVNKTGVTRMLVASSLQRLGTTPTNAGFMYFYMTDQTGTSLDPKLDITHVGTRSPIIFNLPRKLKGAA